MSENDPPEISENVDNFDLLAWYFLKFLGISWEETLIALRMLMKQV